MSPFSHTLAALLLAATVCGPACAHAETANEAGTYTLTRSGDKYSLASRGAPVTSVLHGLSEEAGIPILVDEADDSRVNVSVAGLTFERLLQGISQGYAIIYVPDDSPTGYRIERVVAAGMAEQAGDQPGTLDAADVVERIRERSRGVTRVRQRTSMTVTMMGSQVDMGGQIWKDGDKTRMEFTMPPSGAKQIIVSNGETTYTYTPMMNMVQSLDMTRIKEAMDDPGLAASAASPVPDQSDVFYGLEAESLQYFGVERMAGESMYVMDGAISEKGRRMMGNQIPTPASARFWVSVKDGMPRKMAFFGADGEALMTQSFSDVALNPDLDPSLFDFQIPAGAQVVDMTDMVLSMYKAMANQP